jgi:hypothetical protein
MRASDGTGPRLTPRAGEGGQRSGEPVAAPPFPPGHYGPLTSVKVQVDVYGEPEPPAHVVDGTASDQVGVIV